MTASEDVKVENTPDEPEGSSANDLGLDDPSTADDPLLDELADWTLEEIGEAVQESSIVGSDYDVDDLSRFVRGVVAVVRKREAVDTRRSDPKQLSVFLLFPAGGEGHPRAPMLDDGLTTITGRVWFVNAPVVSGRGRPLEVQDPEGVFRFVTDELRMGSIPAVVVDQRLETTSVRYYQRGLAEPDACEHVRLGCGDITLDEICGAIERVYQQCMITPGAQSQTSGLWKDASKHHPLSDAEQRVQALLKPGFAAAFPTCRVYEEVRAVAGRADLHLEEQDPLDRSKKIFVAVLELKVLRSYSDTGLAYPASHSADAIEKGVKQAGGYKRERGYRVAALCCFDLRKEDLGEACFESVSELATVFDVALRRWYLYASSELYRDATVVLA